MFQPKYPLSLSDLEGAYTSIKDIQENIKQNIKFLLLTSPGEWPGRPELGVGIRRFLFSNHVSSELLSIHKRISDQFARYMPFVRIESELIDKDSSGQSFVDRNEIKLLVRYSVPSVNISEKIILNISGGSNEVF